MKQAVDYPFNDLLELSTMTMATVSRDGSPHAAPLYFVCDERLRLYFFSERDSQHGQDVAGNRRAAVTIYPECRHWSEIRGLQMRGEVRLVTQDAEWKHAWDLYVVKFPFVSELQDILASNLLYVFIPRWIRNVDNRKGFGFKEEWSLA